jgi:hypothetical protein
MCIYTYIHSLKHKYIYLYMYICIYTSLYQATLSALSAEIGELNANFAEANGESDAL